MDTPPTRDDLARLYGAATHYRELAPWTWMMDHQLFGVHDADVGMTAYCSVLGAAGEVFGIAAYPGDEGFRSYLRMSSGEPFAEAASPLCLLVSFEDRDELTKRDRDEIAGLGLKYRGRSAWPLFRSYRPGYAPWHLVGWEARLAATAMEQALDICRRGRVGALPAAPAGAAMVLLRRREAGGRWSDAWEPAPLPDRPQAPPLPPPERIAEVFQKTRRSSNALEVGLLTAGRFAERGERPYFGLMWLCVDRGSGFVLSEGSGLIESYAPPTALQDAFLQVLMAAGALPAEVAVAQDEAYDLLRPLGAGLNVRVTRAKRLAKLDRIRKELQQALDRGL